MSRRTKPLPPEWAGLGARLVRLLAEARAVRRVVQRTIADSKRAFPEAQP